MNLSTVQVEDIKSYERESAVVIASISPHEFSLHKAHVGIEGEMGRLAADRVGTHTAYRGPTDKTIEIGYCRWLGTGRG